MRVFILFIGEVKLIVFWIIELNFYYVRKYLKINKLYLFVYVFINVEFIYNFCIYFMMFFFLDIRFYYLLFYNNKFYVNRIRMVRWIL